MGLLNLGAEKPVPGTLGDANQIANAFTEIEAAVNSLDESNFGAGQILEPTKIKSGGASPGQSLTWDGSNWAPGGGGSVPVGGLLPFVGLAANVAAGWLLCDGINTVLRGSPLGLLLAGRFGPGDGTNTFNVPNLKGRMPVGLDAAQTEFDVMGDTGGAKAISISQLPSHSHGGQTGVGTSHYHSLPYAAWTSGPTQIPGWIAAGNPGTLNAYYVGTGLDAYFLVRTGDEGSHYHGVTAEGGNHPHGNMPPFLTINYIIKT